MYLFLYKYVFPTSLIRLFHLGRSGNPFLKQNPTILYIHAVQKVLYIQLPQP